MVELNIQGAFGPITFTPAAGQPAPTAADMARLDAYLAQEGLTLPDDYRAFLMATNGGKVDPSGFAYRYDAAGKALLAQVLDEEDEILSAPANDIRYFHGFAEGPITDLIDLQRHVKAWGRPGLFGIASASFGDLVVLDLQPGEGYGAVHYLTLQGVAPLVEEGQEVPLGFVAGSFEAFRTGLFDLDEVMAEVQGETLQGFLDRVLGRR